MKQGYKTTEFWVALATNIVGLAVLSGWIGPEQSEPTLQAVEQIVGALMALGSTYGYSASRGQAKRSQP